MQTGTAIFPDTSIHIARLLREPEMKKIIEQRLASYDLVVSSSVVVQEFKRRILPEAIYLINQLNNRGSYQKVKRHVTHVLPEIMKRKRQICLGMLEKIFEDVGNVDDSELTERAKLYLHTLIKHGVKYFQSKVGHIIPGTNCYLSKLPVKVKQPYKYEPIETKCSNVYPLCPIVDFLKEKKELCKQFLEYLSNLSNKTKELENTLEFLRGFVTNPDIVHEKDPCYCVGDLLVALESHNIPDFYTMNYKESKFFCDVLEQDLIVLPNNPDKSENTYSKNSKPWNL